MSLPKQTLTFASAIETFKQVVNQEVVADFNGENEVTDAVKSADSVVKEKLKKLADIDSENLSIVAFNTKGGFFGNAQERRTKLRQDLKNIASFATPSTGKTLGKKTINPKNPLDGKAASLFSLEISEGVAAENEAQRLLNVLDLLADLEAEAILARSKTVSDAARDLRQTIEAANKELIESTKQTDSGKGSTPTSNSVNDSPANVSELYSDLAYVESASWVSQPHYVQFSSENDDVAPSETYLQVFEEFNVSSQYSSQYIEPAIPVISTIRELRIDLETLSQKDLMQDLMLRYPQKVKIIGVFVDKNHSEINPLAEEVKKNFEEEHNPEIDALVAEVRESIKVISETSDILAQRKACSLLDLKAIKRIRDAATKIREIFQPYPDGKESDTDIAVSELLESIEGFTTAFLRTHETEPQTESLDEARERFTFERAEFGDSLSNYEDFAKFMLERYGLSSKNASQKDIIIRVSDAIPSKAELHLATLQKEILSDIDNIFQLMEKMHSSQSFHAEQGDLIADKIARMARLLKIKESEPTDFEPIDFFFRHFSKVASTMLSRLEENFKKSVEKEELEKSCDEFELLISGNNLEKELEDFAKKNKTKKPTAEEKEAIRNAFKEVKEAAKKPKLDKDDFKKKKEKLETALTTALNPSQGSSKLLDAAFKISNKAGVYFEHVNETTTLERATSQRLAPSRTEKLEK